MAGSRYLSSVLVAALAAPVYIAGAPLQEQKQTVVLREGTDIVLTFVEGLSSKTAAQDDPVPLVLAEDVVVDGIVVAKVGAKARGTVTHVKKAGMAGKGAELNMRLDYVLIGDQRVKIRGTKGQGGQNSTGSTIALAVALGPIALIRRGKEVEVKAGSKQAAYVDADTPVTVGR